MQPVLDLLRRLQSMAVVGHLLDGRRLAGPHDYRARRGQALGVHGAQLVAKLLRDILDEFDLARSPRTPRPFLRAAESHGIPCFLVRVR